MKSKSSTTKNLIEEYIKSKKGKKVFKSELEKNSKKFKALSDTVCRRTRELYNDSLVIDNGYENGLVYYFYTRKYIK